MEAAVALPRSARNNSRHGSSDTAVSELTAMPTYCSSIREVTIATPVAKAPITERNFLGSIAGAAKVPHVMNSSGV